MSGHKHQQQLFKPESIDGTLEFQGYTLEFQDDILFKGKKCKMYHDKESTVGFLFHEVKGDLYDFISNYPLTLTH